MIGRLLELFDYDPIEGVLTWKRVWPRCHHKFGEVVCSKQVNTAYPIVRINGEPVYLHIIAWMMYNEQPVPEGLEIDHIDRNPRNIKANNLRAVTHSKNQENRIDSRNKHGEKGISFNKLKKKFAVDVLINGVSCRKSGISSLTDAIKIRDEFINGLEKQ